MKLNLFPVLLMSVALAAWLSGCGDEALPPEVGALALVTAALTGDAPLDREIARLQRELAEAEDPIPLLERLGLAFVDKAEQQSDSGFYGLAEQCALAIEELEPGRADAALLRGRALHGLHRFGEAEALAQALVARRGLSYDYGLLGDVLLDRGRNAEAATAYQSMMDLRPDANSYARAAHVRFLTGDLPGALQAMELAARAASPRAPGTFGWIWSRLALYRLQAKDFEGALADSERAVRAAPHSASVRLVRGRVLLGLGRHEEASAVLEAAADRAPLPEVLWALAESLAASGREREAAAVEERLLRSGESNDPRGFALYLASIGRDLPRALELARRELRERPDAYSHEALAWAEAASGNLASARSHMAEALAAGTPDARLYYHAAVIASRAGAEAEAARQRSRAAELGHMLLPSQRRALGALGAVSARSNSTT
jgi:tetratricopeptide (TPR) repeat protein